MNYLKQIQSLEYTVEYLLTYQNFEEKHILEVLMILEGAKFILRT